MPLGMMKEELKELLKEKYPKKFQELVKQGQLDSYLQQELVRMEDYYETLMKQNPQLNSLEARELAMEEYL